MAISFQSAILVYAVGCRADGHNCFSCDIVFKVVLTALYTLKIDELWHTQSLFYMQVLLYVAANTLFLPFLPYRLETFSGKMVSLLCQSSCVNVASVHLTAFLRCFLGFGLKILGLFLFLFLFFKYIKIYKFNRFDPYNLNSNNGKRRKKNQKEENQLGTFVQPSRPQTFAWNFATQTYCKRLAIF